MHISFHFLVLILTSIDCLIISTKRRTSSRECERIWSKGGVGGSERIRSGDVSDAFKEVLRENTRLPRTTNDNDKPSNRDRKSLHDVSQAKYQVGPLPFWYLLLSIHGKLDVLFSIHGGQQVIKRLSEIRYFAEKRRKKKEEIFFHIEWNLVRLKNKIAEKKREMKKKGKKQWKKKMYVVPFYYIRL